MRILLVGDIHFRAKKLVDISSAWRRIVGYAAANDIRIILQAGDVFDHPNIYGRDADMGTIYHEFLSPLADSPDIKTIIVPGNHDMGGPKDLDALAPLDGHPSIQIIRRPSVVSICKGLSACAMPWVNRAHLVARMIAKGCPPAETNEKVGKAIAGIAPYLSGEVAKAHAAGDVVVAFGHVEVTGAKLTGGQTQANGLFEFSPKELASIGADAYGLAHIHVRQPVAGLPRKLDGYLGTICQLSFGEEGNHAGFRVLDVENGAIVDDVYVDDNKAPKYFTVDSLDGLNYRSGVDYVKVRGLVRPEGLPDGVVFERKPAPCQPRKHGDLVLDADTPIETLLKLWHSASKCEADISSLISTATQLASQASVAEDSIGSLERVNGISLKNITCHESTEIDLSNASGLIGIEGSNGSGKTTAMEAIILALYGVAPSRPYLPVLIRRGCQEPSSVGTSIVSRGKKYTAKREFKSGKTFSHKAYLLEDGQEKAIAGPKVEDVAKSSSSMVGDLDLVMAGIFSSQGEGGNILELDPSERKELFAKVLGTSKFLVLAEMAKKQANGDNAEIEALKAKMERLRLEVADEEPDKSRLSMLVEMANDARNKVSKLTADMECAKKALAEAAVVKKTRADAIARKGELASRMDAIRKQGRDTKAIRDELLKADPKPIEVELEEARKASGELESLKKTIQDRLAQAKTLQAEAETIHARAKAMVADIAAKYAAKASELSSKEAAFRKKRNDELRILLDQKAKASADVVAAAEKLAMAKRKSTMIDGFPNAEICKACPLAKDGLEWRGQIQSLSTKLEEAEQGKIKLESAILEHEAETEKRVDSVRKSFPTEPDFMPGERGAAGNMEAQATKKEAEASACQVTSEEKDKVLSLKAVADRIKPIEDRLASAKEASIGIARAEATMVALKTQLVELQAEEARIVVPDEIDDSPIKALSRNLADEIREANASLEASHVEIGRGEAKMEMYAKKNAEMADIEKKIASKKDRTDVLNALASAFGRDGIPQMIVDSTIPRFQDIMADLMSEFDGKWTIKVNSQKTTKAGAVKEVIDVLVDDGSGEADVITFSGGERQLLRMVIRVAFSTLQAERSGKGLKVLVLDEATYAMDEDNATNFMRMLGKLSSFNQVFVISHNDRVLSSLPTCLSFSRQCGQSPKIVMRSREGIVT